ncbi:MAG TPA: helix-turn-helix transcriptional regulator [Chloroflexota bacterium]
MFDPESFELAIRMRAIRLRQGLKQTEVARRMGLDPSMPSLWERGKRLVPRHRVPALAAALEVSVDELRGQADGRD